jgi:DNA primase
MARIPDHEIERLKAEVSVERLAEARGITLERHGMDLIGLCPFHDDHEPSLVITPAKNLWLCGAPHNQSYAESFIMRS